MIPPHKEGRVLRCYLPPERIRRARRVFRRRGVTYLESMDSIYLQSLQMKYMRADRVMEWPDRWGVVYPQLPGEAARNELSRAFPDLKKVGWKRGHKRLYEYNMPMFCNQTYKGEGAHVDLEGAYYNIYRHLWLDVAFPRGVGSLSLRGVADRLAHWKPARNAVIGIVRSLTARVVSKNRAITIYPDNPYLSPCLWATVQDTLHSLAKIAMSCGAVYCMTDGYIFRDQKGCRVFLDYLDELQCPYRVGWGEVDLRGWTSYSTPLKTTQAYKRGRGGAVGVGNLRTVYNDPFKMPDWVYKKCRSYHDG